MCVGPTERENSNGIFHRNRKGYLKIYMELPKTPNSHSNLKKERIKQGASCFVISNYTTEL